MKTWRFIVTVVSLPILLALAVAASTRPDAFRKVTLKSGTEIVRVAQPSRWVPFQAEQIIYFPGGEVRARRYRAADGSLATYDLGGGLSTIHNVAAGRTFAGSTRTNQWTSYPLDPRFPPKLTKEYGVKAGQFKISKETIHGSPVIELSGKSGTITFFVPALNNLALRAYDKTGKLVSEYRNVQLEIPGDRLFQPPPGAKIKLESKPFKAKADTHTSE